MFLLRGRKRSIIDLPPEVIDQILRHLSLVSQACLVLSCKRFYQQFEYIVKAPAFRYPYSDGPDWSTDVGTRIKLLSKLETRGFKFRRWLFCASCLKLHPRKEFWESDKGERPSGRACRWRGVIILCPCVKFSPKRLTGYFLSELNMANDANSSGPDIRKHIRDWHQCQFSDRELSYKLSISLSCDERRVLFHFDYLIDVNQSELDQNQVGRRIMLCRHVDAHSEIKRNKHCPSMNCTTCGIRPSVKVTMLENRTRYLIEFVRKYNRYDDPGNGPLKYFRLLPRDYDWRR